MADDLPADDPGGGGLPTLGDRIAEWLGFQLPSIPMPQTLKNLDKSVSTILLAVGENAKARIQANTGKVNAAGKIAVEGMYRTEEEKRKIENRADIVAVAVEDLNSTSTQQQEDASDEIEDDWLNFFAKIAEDKSSDELKSLFGRILAGEIRKPGSFSLRSLQFLSTLSKSDAHQISKFFSFVLIEQLVPIDHQLPVRFADRVLMEELGLVSHPSEIGGLAWNFVFSAKGNSLLKANGAGIIVVNETERPIRVSVNSQIMTKTGAEIYKIANPPSTDMMYLNAVAQLLFEKIREAGHAEEIVKLGTIKVLAGPLRSTGGGIFVAYTAAMPGQSPEGQKP